MTYKETLEKAKQNGIGALELKIADMVNLYLTDIDEKLSDEQFESLCDIVKDKLQSMGGEIPYTLYDVVEEALKKTTVRCFPKQISFSTNLTMRKQKMASLLISSFLTIIKKTLTSTSNLSTITMKTMSAPTKW